MKSKILLNMNLKFLKILFVVLSIVVCACSPEDGENGVDGIDGVDGTNGTNGEDGSDGADGQDGAGANGGATFLVLSGAITNEEAATRINERVGVNTQFIIIQNTTNLTTVRLSGITEVIDIDINNNEALASISLPDLGTVVTSLNLSSNTMLTSVEAPALLSVNLMTIRDNDNLNSTDFPLLEDISTFIFEENANLTSFSLPVLESVEGLFIRSNENLNEINLTQLANISRIRISENANLTSFTLPALESTSDMSVSLISITRNDRLETITMPQLVNFGDVTIEDNLALTSINFPFLTTVSLLRVSGTLLSNIVLPAMTNAGSLSLSFNSALTELGFPVLEMVNSLSISSNNVLRFFEMPELTTIGILEGQQQDVLIETFSNEGSIFIGNNDNLEGYSFPQLSILNGRININSNSRLEALGIDAQLSSESSVSNISIRNNRLLSTLNFTNLTNVGSLSISFNEALQTISFPLLETLSNENIIVVPDFAIDIDENLSLSSVSLPFLRETELNISVTNNSVLSELDFSALESFDFQFSLLDNNFSSETLDTILADLVSITPPLTNKIITISNRALPTNQGFTDVQTLINNGNTVDVF